MLVVQSNDYAKDVSWRFSKHLLTCYISQIVNVNIFLWKMSFSLGLVFSQFKGNIFVWYNNILVSMRKDAVLDLFKMQFLTYFSKWASFLIDNANLGVLKPLGFLVILEEIFDFPVKMTLWQHSSIFSFRWQNQY